MGNLTNKVNLQVVIEEKVPIVNYTLGRPPEIVPLIKAVHDYGGKILATVALVKHAVRAEQLGADAINVTGHEAAAHAGFATSMVLVPIVASSIKVPFLSAGGYFDGRGLAAAVALGADGITMGTRLAMTKESRLHDKWKQIIMKSSEQDTIYIDVGDPAINSRVHKNKQGEAARKKRPPLFKAISGAFKMKRLLKLSWWKLISSGFSSSSGEGGVSMFEQLRYTADTAEANKVMFEGDENAGTMPLGQVIGGIRDVPSVAELIERTMIEARHVLESARQKV